MKIKIKNILNFFTKFFKQYEIICKDNNPIVLQYENKTNEDKDAIMFGFNEYFSEDNFGNKGIDITNLQVGGNNTKGYEMALYQSAYKPYDILTIKVISDEPLTAKYKDLMFVYNKKDANGIEYTSPFNLFNYYDNLQVQQDMIEMNFSGKGINIDCRSFIKFKLLANTKLIFIIFPTKSIFCNYFEIKKILKENRNSVIIKK